MPETENASIRSWHAKNQSNPLRSNLGRTAKETTPSHPTSVRREKRPRGGDTVAVAGFNMANIPSIDFEDLLDKQCPFHPKMKHSACQCYDLRGMFASGRLNIAPRKGGPKKTDDENKGQDGDQFPTVDKDAAMIFGGHGAMENRRRQKLSKR